MQQVEIQANTGLNTGQVTEVCSFLLVQNFHIGQLI